MIRLTQSYPNLGPKKYKWVCDICLKSITKHQTFILCSGTKHWVHLKCSQITKDYNNLWYCTLCSTFNHRALINTTSPKNFLKVLQLNANGIHNKTDEIQLLMPLQLKIHKQMSLQYTESKLNQSHKTPNISHFISIRTDCTPNKEEAS